MSNIDITEQESANLTTDAVLGFLKIANAFSYKNVTVSGSTNVKGSAGFLHSVTVNQPASGVTLVITDNTAAGGTIIGTVKNAEPLATATLIPLTLVYDVYCPTGINASQVSPIATGMNLTFSYK